MSLEIVQAHGFASLQGAQNFARLQFGVPVAGAFDTTSAHRANRIVGNEPGATCLELALCSVRVRAQDSILLGIAGARCVVSFRGQSAKPGAPLWLQAGDEVDIAQPSVGVLTYVAIRGGFRPAGLVTQRIRAGDVLGACALIANEPVVVAQPWISLLPIEVDPGPQASMFNMGAFFAGKYEITRQIDRRGLRLNGLPLHGGKEIVSEPCCPGCIQVTPNGQLIIVGPDGPTIGGYPKIAVCSRAGLSLAAQAQPGERIVFVKRH